jgi:hypothetical protein
MKENFEFKPKNEPEEVPTAQESSPEPAHKTRITPVRYKRPESGSFDVAEARESTKPSDEILAYYQVEKLNTGGENVVFETKKHPDIVVKLSMPIARDIAADNARHNAPINSLSKDKRQEVEGIVKSMRDRQSALEHFFDRGEIRKSRFLLQKMPMNPAILSALLRDNTPRNVASMWTIVTIQQRSKALELLKDPNTVQDCYSLATSYPEDENTKPQSYDALNEDFIFHPSTEKGSEIPRETFTDATRNPHIKNLLERADHDPELKEKLRNFFMSAIAYSKATGDIIDMSGSHNISIFKKDGTWNLEVLDNLYPESRHAIVDTRVILRELNHRGQVSERDIYILANTLNYTRFVNGMAHYLNLPERVEIWNEASSPRIDLYKELHPWFGAKNKPPQSEDFFEAA